MRPSRRGRRLRPLLDQLDDRCLLSGLTPAQLAGAYGLAGISFTTSSGTVQGNGTGQTIALIEAYNDPTLASDLHTFDKTYGLSDPRLTVVNQAGTQSDSGWTQEESLDVEWAHALAPGASILVVEAGSQSLGDLLTAVDTARNTPGVSVVSMSWGYNEMSNEASYDSHFTTPAGHIGITFVAASGDSGMATYPATSPNVLAVGGTTLNLSSSGAYQSETAWIFSGGGYSMFEPEPSYQAAAQQTGQRSTPDVAFNADPSSGVPVYVRNSSRFGGTQGTWMTVGGTSLGSPAWAAIIAIADQGRALSGLGSLDGPTQTLPTLYALPSADYHAVAAAPSNPYGGGEFGFSGGLGFGGFGGFGFGSNLGSSPSSTTTSSSATANTETGLGSPVGSSIVSGLVASTLTVPITTVSGPGSGGTTPTAPTAPTGGSRHPRRTPTRRRRAVNRTRTHAATHVHRPAPQGTSARKLSARGRRLI
jgi:hypothetical protein